MPVLAWAFRLNVEIKRIVAVVHERIAVAAYADAVRFYVRLIENAAGGAMAQASRTAAVEPNHP